MTPSRFLLLCFAGTLCLAQAAAQSAPTAEPPVTPPGTLVQTPSLTTFPPLTAFAPQSKPASTLRFDPATLAALAGLAALSKAKIQLPRHSSSCYTLRSYVINNDDMRSSSPRPSSSSTCTESATVRMKDATFPSRP
jgi:hypothetical protein